MTFEFPSVNYIKTLLVFFMSLLSSLLKLERHFGLWLFIFILTSASMGVALFYQYAMAWDPCVICIHIRVYMLGLMALSLLMIFLSRFKFIRLLGFIAQSALAIPLFLTCRELYRIEVGLQQAGCMFNAGLPAWFDLEVWLPSIFEVRSACGDSPVLLFDITMAEALYVGSAIAMLGAVLLSLLSIFSLLKQTKTI